MNDHEALQPSDPFAGLHELETLVFARLSERYPRLSREVMLPWKRDRISPVGGQFDGDFRGTSGCWLVEVIPADHVANPETMAMLRERFEALGEDKYDAALFVIPDGDYDRQGIAAGLRGFFPGKHVELAAVSDLQVAAAFDDIQSAYPGGVVNIDRTSAEYHAAIEAIDAVAAHLRTSNSIDLRADIRDRLYVEVQAGRTLFDAATVRVAALSNTVVPALRFMGDVCDRAALGELAKEALKALVKLIFG